MGIFHPEGKLAGFLNKLGDVMILNLLTVICCIPVVTVGAALTALYSVTLKMVKNEEGKIVHSYFKAFRDNFKQATALWGIGAGVLLLIAGDIYLLRLWNDNTFTAYQGVLLILFVVAGLVLMYVFPVLARFDNTTKNTVKNAFLFCMIHFFRSLLLMIVMLLPLILTCLSLRFLFLDVLFGISGPAYLMSIYYRSLFRNFEQCIETI